MPANLICNWNLTCRKTQKCFVLLAPDSKLPICQTSFLKITLMNELSHGQICGATSCQALSIVKVWKTCCNLVCPVSIVSGRSTFMSLLPFTVKFLDTARLSMESCPQGNFHPLTDVFLGPSRDAIFSLQGTKENQFYHYWETVHLHIQVVVCSTRNCHLFHFKLILQTSS